MTKKQLEEKIKKLVTALEAARDHLEYCGYGDNWEREGAIAQKLPELIDEALGLVRKE